PPRATRSISAESRRRASAISTGRAPIAISCTRPLSRKANQPHACRAPRARRTTPRMHVEPFRIAVPDAVLADLRERLARTRFPDEIPGSGWTYGTSLAYLRELVAYWRERFDWRAAEARLNALPQFRARVGGLGIHFIHVRGTR